MLQIERRICAEPQPKHVRVFQHCGFDSKRGDAPCHFGRGAQILSLRAVPMAETARSVVFNLVKADAFYPNTQRNVEERKHYMTLALADLNQLYQDLQCLLAMKLPVKVAKFEEISESIENDIKLIKGARAGVKLIGKG